MAIPTIATIKGTANAATITTTIVCVRCVPPSIDVSIHTAQKDGT